MKKLIKQVKNAKELVFLDLEGTQFSHELICLGAVIVKLKSDYSIKRIDKGFKVYVTPKNDIGHFVENLTGITKTVLEQNKAVPFKEAIIRFKKYVGKYFNNAKFVTFGNHDMRILNQSMYHSSDADLISVRQIVKNNLDLASIISEYVRDDKNNSLSLTNYCKLFDVKTEGVAHDALYDAKNLALLYDAVLKNTKLVEEEYFKTILRTRSVPRPIANLIKQLATDGSVNLNDLQKYVRQDIDGRKSD